MGARVRFVDTTFRDGSQSLWAMNMRRGMMEAVAADLDCAGLDVIEVPSNAINFKKMVRDLKEDPWDLMRSMARLMPRTEKACMGGGVNLNPLGAPTPPELGKLFWEIQREIGAIQRIQVVCNTADQIERQLPVIMPFFQGLGMKVACALSYSISPRHTDDHYAEKTRGLLPFKPDVIYLKDQSGLLTVDRLRSILPVIQANAGDIPIELHSHCTTGLAPLVYMEALKLGVLTIHTGVPPLAEGPAQPSVLQTLRNAQRHGFSTGLDESLLASIAQRLTAFAMRDGMPLGRPMPYDAYQYVHQIPGGVISNLKFQLGELRQAHRIDEVIAECAAIHAELGYPVMITPFSQFVATQATMNVVTGERYQLVIDELIRFARGIYGRDSGFEAMDPDLKDRLLGSQRARELAELDAHAMQPASVQQYRETYGGAGVSDEEFLLRVIMQGTSEIDAMRASGPPPQYFSGEMPVVQLIEALKRHDKVRSVHISLGRDSIALRNGSVHHPAAAGVN
jgi:oxaloacetate decarboxylase alpha subunit